MKQSKLQEVLSEYDVSQVVAVAAEAAQDRFKHPALTESLGAEASVQLKRLSHDLQQIEHLHTSLSEITE
ncbi:hypothetical protein N836_35790 [Leptolyngbya sp. Heron Island J]|uniref:hypothetical protein n=1 Tax=Leptolyngbya sp. Heron Island J TaxID=1385935 RepID=UPI0003B96B32|nr:hypothetical protein [Leptolyngbya sp. Heron Island J]ESA37737.1 hypothetical protein N836_35790 [Leptolyngbya sp. Heron Island J]